MSVQPPALPPVNTRTRHRQSFGVSLSPASAVAIDRRVTELAARFGFTFTRSSYFELLARHDQQHRLIEQILAAAK